MNFQIETTTHCNFTCGYCPNRDMERKRQFIADDVWQTILDSYVVPYRHVNSYCPPTAIFHKDGESLLDKKLPLRLRQLADAAPDMKVDIYSNGVLLPKLASQGKDFIDVLASLPNQVRYMMSYHPFNHDNSVNDYSEVIPYLRDVLRDPPRNVEFITVSHRSKWVSEALQDAWERTWEGLPITVHKNCSINPWTGRMEDVATCKYNGCPYADFGHWFFGVTGNVIACCLDLEEEIVLGNVLTDSPEELFNRTKAFYEEQRRSHTAQEKPAHHVCYDCYGHKRPHVLVELGMR